MPEAVRRRVLDPQTSFLVQAPAGSGKTELLTQRFLALLGRVEQPEAVVAITFTKKAAGEMRARLLHALEMALGPKPEEDHKRQTWTLAEAVNRRRWDLIENPARLRIQTFDSFCRSLTEQMPWLSRLGAPPQIAEDTARLHYLAALEAVRAVEQGDPAVARLLAHLDNQFSRVTEKLAEMLARRDQWLRHLHIDRAGVERALRAVAHRHFAQLAAAAPSSIVGDWPAVQAAALTKSGTVSRKWAKATGASPEFEALLVKPLPPTDLTDAQWEIISAILEVLKRAAAELKLLFQERRQTDHAEVPMAAMQALGLPESPTPLAEALYARIEHLLVDEFQDTSASQYEILRRLTAEWVPGDGRTLFLVGDPMQSIYGFREADVGLFLRAATEGLGHLPLEFAQLNRNFRSDRELIGWFNSVFPSVLAPAVDVETGAVPYAASEATREYSDCRVEPRWGGAVEIAGVVEAHPEQTIAILVRNKSHATPIMAELQRRGIRYQAVDLDTLGERSAVRDLEALTRALLHPEDRTAYLAVCRAPWAGATLAQLAAGELPERVVAALDAARRERQRGSLRRQVEQLWLTLGGPATLTTAEEQEDAAAFFNLLDGFDPATDLTTALARLFARPDPLADGRIQILSMHKAKGLEFDVVILPELHRPAGNDQPSLLRWRMAEDELLLGCIRETGAERDPVYDYLSEYERTRSGHEMARLLYVACTRAKRRLFLFVHGKLRKGTLGHLLEATLTPVLQPVTAPVAAAPHQMLRRLPAAWVTPAPPPEMPWPRTEEVDAVEEAAEQTAAPEVRAVGTLAHRLLQRMAREGLAAWPAARLGEMAPFLAAHLPAEGVERCLAALRATLASQRGRWILTPHAEARNEWALTGLVAGQRVSGVLDRTFVDAEGTRWIIDYKTGTAAEAYREQLHRYGTLLAALDDRPIRLGLYYPLDGVWQEWAFSASRPAESAIGQAES
ncbi:MAG: UvrD-helicase domain-containing protein [Acidobacteriota bacterium]|jgi:ATP-dependent exoDNAse (exonuclease V) beta subunit|nr:UvrD-helicase domain-containing protein [Acidobacteriaceae bacterium]